MADKSPMVRVEFEYADGTIQRLVGPPAEQWLDEINAVITFTQVRCGQRQISDFPWEWTHKIDEDQGPNDRFAGYEGTD